MSKDSSSSRFLARDVLEANENELESSLNPAHFLPPRSPLNAIPDPSQCQRDTESQECDFDSKEKSDSGKAQHHRFFDRKTEALSLTLNSVTPRVIGRHGKVLSEPNSAQTTLARSGSRASLGGGVCSGSRVAQPVGGRGGANSSSCSRVSKGISMTDTSDFSSEVPHFELVEDPSFWTDHNVQVLIRIRPLSAVEKVSQGCGRCLRLESAQTLVWLGHPEIRFTFDHIACETISQEKLFRVAGLPMVENCMSGYNSCMFAYGQTGSGKTYTMMGEIYQAEGKLNEDCGITPRIFEYLFSRIIMEEENRKDEQLKFSCKCSFLEIYNEQITDLLEPSSTNLQLREDLKKGVYVENLTECNVQTVDDVLKLLLQGAANRKIAATHMNSESSRSHSVFTCIIESRWDKDSMTHFRFARLNLVDLAGSERQKSSGAEGERLKEAANINKSLSTLGLVIMSLVDLAHGKHRHVPYRDSRLTFLLQDSLGGNSKTTIIANISPSICAANETLSTLKFAQRAKLIQNNATVNEDASGDVIALQRQIQQLKSQLSSLMKHRHFSSCPSSLEPSIQESKFGDYSEKHECSGERVTDNYQTQNIQNKMKLMEATLAGSLRREKMAETAIQKLEAEIEHMNRMARQREEDTQRNKMMLRFREEKIKELELLVTGSISGEKYLVEENKALKEEIQLLQAKIDRNPEVTRFALENIRLLEQLQLFQNFNDQGEREMLLHEVSDLRDQLLEVLEGKHGFSRRYENQDCVTGKELKECMNINSKLTREVDELRTELSKYLNCHQAAPDSVASSILKDPDDCREADKYTLAETVLVHSDVGDEMASYSHEENVALEIPNDQNICASNMQHSVAQKELRDARLLINAMETKHVHLIKELEHLREENERYMEILSSKDKLEIESMLRSECCHQLDDLETHNKGPAMKSIEPRTFQAKLEKLTKELEDTRFLNSQYQQEQALQLSSQHQADLVLEQVEMETTRTILHLQEEVAALQLELNERLCSATQENTRLRNTVAAKEEEIEALSMGWERATLELTSFLLDGSRSLKDASCQIESIACSFPQINVWIGEHIEKAAGVCIEKEERILLLQRGLEDAQRMVVEMEQKLSSLKGATIALTESQQSRSDETTEEVVQLRRLLSEKIEIVKMLERALERTKDQITEVEKRADAAFVIIKWLLDTDKVVYGDDSGSNSSLLKQATSPGFLGHETSKMKVDADPAAVNDIKTQIELAKLAVLDSGNVINASYVDTEVHLSSFQTCIVKDFSAYKEMVQDLLKEIQETRKRFLELKNSNNSQFCSVKLQSLEEDRSLNYHILYQIKDELAVTNDSLKLIKDCIILKTRMHDCQSMDEYCDREDSWSANSSISSSEFSNESSASGNNSKGFCCSEKTPEELVNLKFHEGSVLESYDQESEMLLLKKRIDHEAVKFSLTMELQKAFDAFNKIYVDLTRLLDENDVGDCSYKGMNYVIPAFGLTTQKAETGSFNAIQALTDERTSHARSFFSKVEEAHATIKEADYMLNALLKANKNEKELNNMWKQAREELIVEKESLVEEVEQLRCLMNLKGGNDSLQVEIHNSFAEISNSMSFLERCFQQIQGQVEDDFKVLHSNVLSMRQEMLHTIGNSRSLLEDICSEIMQKELTLFVLHQCHIGQSIHENSKARVNLISHPCSKEEGHSAINTLQESCLIGRDDLFLACEEGRKEVDGSKKNKNPKERESDLLCNDLVYDNSSLEKELERKEVLVEGLLFDLHLLQESASNTKDIKDEAEKLAFALSQVHCELEMKTNQLDDLLVQHTKLENSLTEAENALFVSNANLEQAKKTIDSLLDQNAETEMLVKELYLKKSEAEERLEEQKEVAKGLEKEILYLNSSVEKDLILSVECIEEDLRKVTSERDRLREEVCSLNDKLEMAYALADEKEAIAVEARQDSEASKIYAEQKEEEVKILEHSVEELECTINVLEKKVYEMDEEVEKHRLIRNSLEYELEALRGRLSRFQNFTEVDSFNTNSVHTENEISRQMQNRLLELQEAHDRIRILEEERAVLSKEVKQCKEHIFELELHSEAQASQYQQKYKTLEAMVREVKADLSNPTATAPTLDRTEKISNRTRGSSSPFRCIATLVHQMNMEKDQELSTARYRIEELEILAANQQKEVCMLKTRLAAAESMTHDVIRDLLGVKLDMTNYANLIDQHQVQKLVEEAQQQTEDFLAKEQEIQNLRKQVGDLIEERQSCMDEISKKDADILAAQMALEQLKQRGQLLSAQNEMLKLDKTNLIKRISELDEIMKTVPTPSNQKQIKQILEIKENNRINLSDVDFTKRLSNSERVLSQVNDELARYRKTKGSQLYEKTYGQSSGTKYRKQWT